MGANDVTINVTAKDGASGVFENIAKRLKAMKAESRAAGEGVLEKTLASPRGLVGAGMDALGMGVQGIVVDAVGRAFQNVTEKIMEMQQRIREGTADTSMLVAEIAKGTPVLGPFIAAWRNLGDIISGAAEKVAQMNASEAAQVAIGDARAAQAKKTRDIINETRGAQQVAAQQSALQGAIGETREVMGVRFSEEQANSSAYRAMESDIDRLKDDPKLVAARDAFNKAQSEGGDPQQLKNLRDAMVAAETETAAAVQAAKDKFAAQQTANAVTRAAAEQEVAKRYAKQRRDDAIRSAEDIAQDMAAAEAAMLEAQGKAFESRKRQIQEQERKELEGARDRYKNFVGNESDPREQYAAQQRLDKELAAIKNKYEAIGKAADKAEDDRKASELKRRDEEMKQIRELYASTLPEFTTIMQPDLQLSARGSGASDRAKEANAQFTQMLQYQKRSVDELSKIRQANDRMAEFFKVPQITELLMGLAT
jgi:hypothetical protein